MLLLLALAVAPTVVIIMFILKFDMYQKEPAGLLVKLFVGGMLSCIPAVILEMIMGDVIVSVFGYAPFFIYTLVNAFIGVALIEELCKYAFAKIIGYRSTSYDEMYDGMIYCVMSALGFATVENILYVFQYGLATAIVRAVTSVPAHAMFALAMGYYMSMAKFDPQNSVRYRRLSIIVPTLIHGTYDALLMLEMDIALLAFIPLMVILYKNAIRYIKSVSSYAPVTGYAEADPAVPASPVQQVSVPEALSSAGQPSSAEPDRPAPSVKYCPNCGTVLALTDRFCPNCGKEQ